MERSVAAHRIRNRHTPCAVRRFSYGILVLAFATAIGPAPLARADDEADRVFEQAKQELQSGHNEQAIVYLDAAVRSVPKQARFFGLRAVARLRKGEYAKGSADLATAVELNPGDAGLGYKPSTNAKLSKQALRHGRQQVELMLYDRPAMAQFEPDTEFLREWAGRKFAGEDLGTRIDWDDSPPLHSDAEHLAPGDGDNAAILVAPDYDSGPQRGRPRSFEELWAGAVYELHNVNYARDFVRLNDEADEGKISKRDFVDGILRRELRAAQQTRAFYMRVFLPWIEKRKLPTEPTLWFCDWWDTPDGVLQSFSDKSAYPWRPYARTHDWATVHRHWRQERYQRALKLLRQMCGEEGYGDDEGDVHYWMGRCLEQLDKPGEAVFALTASIRLDPDNAPAYRARAKLYKQLGQNDKAKADLDAAKKLESEE